MKDLTVFILTHDRGEMLLETIESVLNQTCHDFKFVVSDNSSNDETQKLLKERNLIGQFEYRKRDKEYPSFEHFNLCLSEVDTKYFVLFHDDDIMLSEYVETMYNAINGSEYVAVGCNAYKLQENDTKTRFSSIRIKKTFKNKAELTYFYSKFDVVPFPSYIYSKEKITTKLFENNLGKYSDVLWIISLIELSPILWLPKSYMLYRIHSGQDSLTFDLLNQYKLAKYLYKTGLCKKEYNSYRCRILYCYASRKRTKRPAIIFLKYANFNFFIKSVIKNSFIYKYLKRGVL